MPFPPRSGLLRPVFGSGLALALALALAGTPARAAVDSATVMSLCLEGFETAMAAAGKTPPPGMGAYTCRCFLQQVQKGASISQARSTCRNQAASRFPLP